MNVFGGVHPVAAAVAGREACGASLPCLGFRKGAFPWGVAAQPLTAVLHLKSDVTAWTVSRDAQEGSALLDGSGSRSHSAR
jgi:hypothetical protein